MALRIDGAGILGVPRVPDFNRALPGEELAVAGVPRRQHAVEQVDATGAPPGPGRRASRRPSSNGAPSAGNCAAVWPAMSNIVSTAPRPTAPRSHRPRIRRRPCRRRSTFTQLRERCRLERSRTARGPASTAAPPAHRRWPAPETSARAPRPSERARHRRRRFVFGRRPARALVERHRDVSAEPRLDVGGRLRREPIRPSVEMRLEDDAVFAQPCAATQTEDLVAAGIGEDRPRPAHERVQTAEACDQIVARTQVQVIRIGEDDLGAEIVEHLDRHALDGRAVPTGMNAGVSTTPCARCMRPRRARPARARRSKRNGALTRVAYNDPRDETSSRGRPLRRTIGRARSLARVGGRGLRGTSIASATSRLRSASRRTAAGCWRTDRRRRRLRPKSSSRHAATCTAPRGPRGPPPAASRRRHTRPRRSTAARPDDTEAATALTGLGLDVVFPVLHGHVRRRRHHPGPARARERRLRRLRRARLGRRHGQGRDEGALPRPRPARAGIDDRAAQRVARRKAPSIERIERALAYPLFVKPANLGSSVGITKVHRAAELAPAIDARRRVRPQDRRRARPCPTRARSSARCSATTSAEASVPGEIMPSREFYDYEAKYIDSRSRLEIPAALDAGVAERGAAAGARRLRGDRRQRPGARRLPPRAERRASSSSTRSTPCPASRRSACTRSCGRRAAWTTRRSSIDSSRSPVERHAAKQELKTSSYLITLSA